jgi:hypothetical protein
MPDLYRALVGLDELVSFLPIGWLDILMDFSSSAAISRDRERNAPYKSPRFIWTFPKMSSLLYSISVAIRVTAQIYVFVQRVSNTH